MPSLAQLDQAVREFIAENPMDLVTVVVDASFGHRIDPSELPAYEEAEVAGEVVSPPAGAIGRGDAFLLLIAEKTGATVLSNDSFQEFHGDHSWLFDKGRLIGGKPVPGVGWIFMDRTPVRGHKSREVVKEAKRRKRSEADPATTRLPAEVTGLDVAAPKPRNRPKSVDRAIARATQEVVEPSGGPGRRRRRGGQPPADPVNEPLPFITFIAAHPLGSEVIGSVGEYSSHGAFVEADGAKCYIPLSAMGDPPPRRAREVVTKGQPVTFVVQAFDPQRRGIELALPGFAHIAGGPTPETVDAEIHPDAVEKPRRRGRAAKAGSAPAAAEPALVRVWQHRRPGGRPRRPGVGGGRRGRSGGSQSRTGWGVLCRQEADRQAGGALRGETAGGGGRRRGEGQEDPQDQAATGRPFGATGRPFGEGGRAGEGGQDPLQADAKDRRHNPGRRRRGGRRKPGAGRPGEGGAPARHRGGSTADPGRRGGRVSRANRPRGAAIGDADWCRTDSGRGDRNRRAGGNHHGAGQEGKEGPGGPGGRTLARGRPGAGFAGARTPEAGAEECRLPGSRRQSVRPGDGEGQGHYYHGRQGPGRKGRDVGRSGQGPGSSRRGHASER